MTAIGEALGRTAAGVRMKAYKLGILTKPKKKTATKAGKRGGCRRVAGSSCEKHL
jgi:hypothetical protein